MAVNLNAKLGSLTYQALEVRVVQVEARCSAAVEEVASFVLSR